MDLVARPAQDDDYPWLFDLHRAAHRALVEMAYQPWEDVQQRCYFNAMATEFDVFILEHLNTPAGAVYLGLRDNDTWVEMIQILPTHQSQGIGSAALEWVTTLAAEQNQAVQLQVHRLNPRARALYERAGFVATGETFTHYRLRRSVNGT